MQVLTLLEFVVGISLDWLDYIWDEQIGISRLPYKSDVDTRAIKMISYIV